MTDPRQHVYSVSSFFARLEGYNLKLASSKARFGAMEDSFLGSSDSGFVLRPDLDNISALSEMFMPENVGQLRLLLGDLSYRYDFLLYLTRHLLSTSDRLWQV